MRPRVLDLDDIPTITDLYGDKTLTPTGTSPSPLSHIPTPKPSSSLNDRISLLKYDITKLRLTAIVNAANGSLLGGGGVDGAIHRAAGPDLVEECETLGGCDTGDAKISGGYELPARFVIHAVGPVYGAERRKQVGREEKLLSSCYVRSLELVKDVWKGRTAGGGEGPVKHVSVEGDAQSAADREKVSIGFSGLSTGIYGYPKVEAARVAIATVLQWLGEHDQEGAISQAVFVCFEQADYDAYIKLLPQFCPPSGTNTEAQTSIDKAASDEQAPKAGNADEFATGTSSRDEDSQKTLDLPDVPTAEPKLPDEPDAKKAKTQHETES